MAPRKNPGRKSKGKARTSTTQDTVQGFQRPHLSTKIEVPTHCDYCGTLSQLRPKGSVEVAVQTDYLELTTVAVQTLTVEFESNDAELSLFDNVLEMKAEPLLKLETEPEGEDELRLETNEDMADMSELSPLSEEQPLDYVDVVSEAANVLVQLLEPTLEIDKTHIPEVAIKSELLDPVSTTTDPPVEESFGDAEGELFVGSQPNFDGMDVSDGVPDSYPIASSDFNASPVSISKLGLLILLSFPPLSLPLSSHR